MYTNTIVHAYLTGPYLRPQIVFQINLSHSGISLKFWIVCHTKRSIQDMSVLCKWSRGFLFDIIFNPRFATSEILKTNGRGMVPITVEELKLYTLTHYGAYGRLLLHFSSGTFHITSVMRYLKAIIDDFNAQRRNRAFPNPYGIRIILFFYSIFRPLVQLMNMIKGPSNWTVCLRTLLVYHDRTLENSTRVQTVPSSRYTPISLISPGHMDYALRSSF